MIDFQNFLNEGAISYNPADPDTLLDEIDRLHGLLYQTARRYNRTWKELENLKKLHGFYDKAFPFLRFPREIRDKIYAYALRAPSTVTTGPRDWMFRTYENDPWSFKPLAPGLILANKQIYQEALPILYLSNVFKFTSAKEMSDFEDRIGASNRDLVRKIEIAVIFMEVPADDDHDQAPSHWVTALPKSRFEKIVEMEVSAEVLGGTEWETAPMPAPLQRVIEDMFDRKQDKPFRPKFTLKGFRWREEKFPREWEIVTKQWFETEA